MGSLITWFFPRFFPSRQYCKTVFFRPGSTVHCIFCPKNPGQKPWSKTWPKIWSRIWSKIRARRPCIKNPAVMPTLVRSNPRYGLMPKTLVWSPCQIGIGSSDPDRLKRNLVSKKVSPSQQYSKTVFFRPSGTVKLYFSVPVELYTVFFRPRDPDRVWRHLF